MHLRFMLTIIKLTYLPQVIHLAGLEYHNQATVNILGAHLSNMD